LRMAEELVANRDAGGVDARCEIGAAELRLFTHRWVSESKFAADDNT
jgi:hypothetical protein